MTFITPQDTNIIMDEARRITCDEFRQFRKAGASIALQYVSWAEVARDGWFETDRAIGRALDAGMKVILQGARDVPAHYPDDWYCKTVTGRIMRDADTEYSNGWACLSPWNPAARCKLLEFTRDMCKRYTGENVLCIFSHSQEGEALLPAHMPCWFDDNAVRCFSAWAEGNQELSESRDATVQWLFECLSDLVLDLQRIYIQNPHREIFMSLHPTFTVAPWESGAVFNIYAHLRNVIRHLAPHKLNWLVYSYFRPNFAGMYPYIEECRTRLNLNIVTGGEWIEGLLTNSDAAKAAHISALVTSPLHEMSGHNKIEPWFYDAVRHSHEVLCAGMAE